MTRPRRIVLFAIAACVLTAGPAGRAVADGPDRPTFEDVKYGPHGRNVLDFWRAKSDAPTPVIVFIHGGGFVAGDKGRVRPQMVRDCLDHGVSYAAINYRYRTEVPIQDVLRDCGRAVQFLRSKAGDWNIDKGRIAAHGGSAGAGTALWLAFHDDLADPESDDPVLRESSRIRAAGATGCQATYDILRWEEVLGEEAFAKYSPSGDWPGFYGLKDEEEVRGPKGRAIRADVDMLGLIRPGGSPAWLGANRPDGPVRDRGHYLHHPKHALAIKARCDAAGVEAVLHRGADDQAETSMRDFLFKHLGITPRAGP